MQLLKLPVVASAGVLLYLLLVVYLIFTCLFFYRGMRYIWEKITMYYKYYNEYTLFVEWIYLALFINIGIVVLLVVEGLIFLLSIGNKENACTHLIENLQNKKEYYLDERTSRLKQVIAEEQANHVEAQKKSRRLQWDHLFIQISYYILRRVHESGRLRDQERNLATRLVIEGSIFLLKAIAYTLISVYYFPYSVYEAVLLSSKLKTIFMLVESRLLRKLDYVVSKELMDEFLFKKFPLKNNLKFYKQQQLINQQRQKILHEIKNQEDKLDDQETTEKEKELIKQEITYLKNIQIQQKYQHIPIKQSNQELLLNLMENSLYKDNEWFGVNLFEQIQKDDFIERFQFAGQLFESIFSSMPSLVLQFYNNQRNQQDSREGNMENECIAEMDTESENVWYSPTQFEFYKFASSLIEVLQICYQMGYLVFMERIVPIFDFMRMAKKYDRLGRSDVRPY